MFISSYFCCNNPFMHWNILSDTGHKKWNLSEQSLEMPQQHEASTSSPKKSQKIAVETSTCHPDGHIKTYFYITNMLDSLFTYFNAFIVPRGLLLNLSLAVSLTNIDTTSGPAAIIDLLIIIQDPNTIGNVSKFKARA